MSRTDTYFPGSVPRQTDISLIDRSGGYFRVHFLFNFSRNFRKRSISLKPTTTTLNPLNPPPPPPGRSYQGRPISLEPEGIII